VCLGVIIDNQILIWIVYVFQFKLEEDEIMRSEATASGNAQELLNKIRDLVNAIVLDNNKSLA